MWNFKKSYFWSGSWTSLKNDVKSLPNLDDQSENPKNSKPSIFIGDLHWYRIWSPLSPGLPNSYVTLFLFRFTVIRLHHLPHKAQLLNFCAFLENLDLPMANFNIHGTWLLTPKVKSPFPIQEIIVFSFLIKMGNF